MGRLMNFGFGGIFKRSRGTLLAYCLNLFSILYILRSAFNFIHCLYIINVLIIYRVQIILSLKSIVRSTINPLMDNPFIQSTYTLSFFSFFLSLSFSLQAINTQHAILPTRYQIIAPNRTRPQCTSGHRCPHATVHPQIPALHSLVKWRTERQLVVCGMCHDSGYRLFVSLKSVGHRFAVYVDQFNWVVVTAGEQFGAVLGETQGADHFVVGFKVGHLVLFGLVKR